MIDEALLDAPDDLARADPGGLLRAVAASGAQVRSAARGAEEAGLAALRPEGRPGTLLVAGPGPEVPLLVDLLGALAGDTLPVRLLRPAGALPDPGALHWSLPRWIGPLDLLLIASAEGTEPGLTMLVESAYRRGCSVVSVTPGGSPLAEVTTHRRNLTLPLATDSHQDPVDSLAAPGPHWALVTPPLLLGDRLGLFPEDAAGPAAVAAVAERLDAVAERCGPASPTHGNPAKTLATELGFSLPLLWSEGTTARAAARHGAATLAALAGRPALAAALPEALSAHRALLRGALNTSPGAAEDDFFRDRADEPEPLHARIVLLRSDLPHAPDGASASAAVAARELAFEHNTALSELDTAEDARPLETAAELLAQLDFAAVYLALTAGAEA